jgi:hypothetical protein
VKLLLAAAALVATLVVCAATASAATYHWTLAKRAHLTYPGTTFTRTVNATLHNVNGIAVSAHTVQKTSLRILVGGSCTRGGTTKPILGTFTSHGIGTKVPLKVPFGSPNTCHLSVVVDAPTMPSGVSKATTFSIWRR